jgi:uncharacterized cupredoxin-like copper-binding protein
MNVIKLRKPVEEKNDVYTTQRRRLARSVISIVLMGWVSAAAAHEQHGGYSAGEPGNPRKPAREIVVLMNEMDYSPAVIEVKRGEQIYFVLRNVGTEAHEFLLATTAENLKHGEAMKKNRIWSMMNPTVCVWRPGSRERSCGGSRRPAPSNMRL